jgi:hypothetical protein
VLGIQIWLFEMEETASINIFSTSCHRMAYKLHKILSLINVGEKGVSFVGRRAGKLRKVTAQAFLSLVVWSEQMIR